MSAPHVVTAQETELYEAMSAGDWAAVEEARAAAVDADQARPADAGEGWVSPAEQFDVDHANAYSHYQADHEAPEAEREENTAAQVSEENTGR